MPCCPPPEHWVARAQPWLGTLVEVALPAAEATEERFAAAFTAIAHVHRRMNAHHPASDLARIARRAHRRAVVVDRQTMAVLRLSLALARATRGRFDVGVPPRRRRGSRRSTHTAGRSGFGAAIRLGPGRCVRTRRALAIDLSGIAKGHAVDRAVAALRARGASAGLVNAGGDLRVFGPFVWLPVRVRLPQDPARALPLFEVREAAAATSADYFRSARAQALLDPLLRGARRFTDSYTVVAPSCALADALTKVVALAPARAAPLLSRHGAHAFRLGGAGLPLAATTCHRSTPHLRLPAAWET